jgi:hypothetical protein
MTEAKPLIAESSTSEPMQVEAAMNDLRDNLLSIPDYQRDADQWNDEMKSLFIESIINNLTVPAFFFEPKVGKDGIERNEVVDGQQRLTTLYQFWTGKLRLVSADEAPYLTPNSIHYADLNFSKLPLAYQHAFKRYRLTIIKLRNLDSMRLEVFRRINQGGTPLSAQDIRLAYYADSPSVTLVRLAGVHDPDSVAAARVIARLREKGGSAPELWSGKEGDCWADWWGGGKAISNGQTASEMFLWSLMVSSYEGMKSLLANGGAVRSLGVQYNGTMDEALDAACAQLRYQDQHPDQPVTLPGYDAMVADFLPFFRRWFLQICGVNGVNLPVTKYRLVAAVIGAAHALRVEPSGLAPSMWDQLVEMIRRPREHNLPESKGRWTGLRGYDAQFAAVRVAVSKIIGAANQT